MKKEIPGIKMNSDDKKIEEYASIIINRFGNILKKYDFEASKSIPDEISSIRNGDKPMPNIPEDIALSDMYGMENYVNAAVYNISKAKKSRDRLIARAIDICEVPLLYKLKVKNKILKMLTDNRKEFNNSTEEKGERDE